MQDLEKLVEAAVDFRLAKLKAREQGILNISDCGGKNEEFQIYSESDFANMIKGKEYTVEKFDRDWKYQYKGVISGLTFICITNYFIFDGDENKIVEVE